MKNLVLIAVALITASNLRSENVKIIVPSDFDLKSLGEYQLVWFNPKEPISRKVNLAREKIEIPINFGEYIPPEIMLCRNSQYICTLKLTNNHLAIPNVIRLTLDPANTQNGLIFVRALNGNNQLYEEFFSSKPRTIFMPVDGEPIGVYYILPGGKIPRSVKVGVFSVDFNVDYKVKISIKSEGKGEISTLFNNIQQGQ